MDKKQIRKSKAGLAPGSLIFTGIQKMTSVKISFINYSVDTYYETEPGSIPELIEILEASGGNKWINIDGLHDENIIEDICTWLGVHKLTMEDILNVGQRPKIEEHYEYLYLVVKMFILNSPEITINDEQLTFILKNNILITFQEKTGDVFEAVRKRLKEGKGMIRNKTTDYLLYSLLDTIVDQYFMILELFGEKLEEIEIKLLENPDKETLNKLHYFRRETLSLRRSVYPLREVISRFEKMDGTLIKSDLKIFISDLYDHTIQVIDTIEILREMSTGLLDLYMNSISNKMNEIMKVLTIMASIFIPLTFIAGVYGMNFVNMPELQYKYAYFIVWIIMILIFIGMIIYFKRKKWL